MKKQISLIFLTFALCTSQIAFANEALDTSVAAASTSSITQTSPAQTVDNSVYNALGSKIQIKNDLISKENQVCKEIKEQEDINQKKAAAIIEKSQSYSTAYNKIIDDIKLLLNPLKDIEVLYSKDSKSGVSSQEAGIYDRQISNLNLAIRAMRESMKYISLESVEYHKKIHTVQVNIDNINQSIGELNKDIINEKANKDKEWDNFCSAIAKGDLDAASQSYDKMLKIKKDIIQNYNMILQYKKNIGQLMATLDA